MKYFLYLIPFFALTASAQNLPKGFLALTDATGTTILQYDYDKDGFPDTFCAAAKDGDEGARLVASLRKGKLVIESGSLTMCCGSLTQKAGVIEVHSRGMRGFTYYKFRWEAAAQDFRLIGYETESFGNAMNDGSGKSGINLVTGNYEAAFNSYNIKKEQLDALPVVRRRIPVSRRIYLKTFGEQEDEWLSALNYQYLPKAAQ